MRITRPGIALGLVLIASAAGCGTGVDPAAPLIDAGRAIYRDGILPGGEPLTAIVAGDVPILGSQFSCGSCHGRSGMGTAEGAYIVPAIAGRFLFAPSPQPLRPAYTVESLATVLRDGVTPAGRLLDQSVMPRYRLDDETISALAAYLGSLSAGNSPGVDVRPRPHIATKSSSGRRGRPFQTQRNEDPRC